MNNPDCEHWKPLYLINRFGKREIISHKCDLPEHHFCITGCLSFKPKEETAPKSGSEK